MAQQSVTETPRVEDGGITPEGIVSASYLNGVANTVTANASDAEGRLLSLEDFQESRVSFETVTVSGAITKAFTAADPTAGNITLDLPDASTVAGSIFMVKRVANGDNYVEIASTDLIDGYTSTVRLGHLNEIAAFFSDGVGYSIVQRKTDCWSMLSIDSPQSFALETTPKKLTVWNVSAYSTEGRLIADLPSSSVEIVHDAGLAQDGYHVNCTLSVEFTNNNNVAIQVYVDGVPSGVPIGVNCLGSGRAVTLPLDTFIGTSGLQHIEVWVSGESSGTLGILAGSLTVTRILG